MSKRLNVSLETISDLNALLVNDPRHQVRIVAPLRATANLLTSDKDVIRIREAVVLGVWHRVERSNV